MTLFHQQLIRALGWIVLKNGGEVRLTRAELESFKHGFQLTVVEDVESQEIVIRCE